MYQDHLAEPETISGVPDQGASMTGPGWGHWVCRHSECLRLFACRAAAAVMGCFCVQASRDFVHWTQLPVAIWNDKWWDASAVYSGSATIVNGSPVIVYPGLYAKPAPKRGAESLRSGHDTRNHAYAVAVPLDLSDPFLTNWCARDSRTSLSCLTQG